MNPLTNMKNVSKLSERELQSDSKSSWHDQYKDSAWLFIGGLPYDLTEGDIICIFSQYGEIVNINLIRDKDTGKSKGFCFLCYEDQRSTVLAVDNLNGIKVLNRFMRVDHVQKYKVPKEGKKTDDETKKLYSEGCAPKLEPLVPKIATPVENSRPTLADQIEPEIKLPQRLPIYNVKKEELSDEIKEENHEKEYVRSVKEKKISKHKKSRHSERDLSSSEQEAPKKKKSKRSHSEKDQIEEKRPRKDAKIFKTKKKL